MRLSNVCDEDLKAVSLLKTRKGTYSSEAKRAQQILRTRNVTKGFGSYGFGQSFINTLDSNSERCYRSFAEENDGLTLEQYLQAAKERNKRKE